LRAYAQQSGVCQLWARRPLQSETGVIDVRLVDHLVEEARAGSRDAQQWLIHRFRPLLEDVATDPTISWAYRIHRCIDSPERAMNFLQEIFVEQVLPQWNPARALGFAAWMAKFGKRKLRDALVYHLARTDRLLRAERRNGQLFLRAVDMIAEPEELIADFTSDGDGEELLEQQVEPSWPTQSPRRRVIAIIQAEELTADDFDLIMTEEDKIALLRALLERARLAEQEQAKLNRIWRNLAREYDRRLEVRHYKIVKENKRRLQETAEDRKLERQFAEELRRQRETIIRDLFRPRDSSGHLSIPSPAIWTPENKTTNVVTIPTTTAKFDGGVKSRKTRCEGHRSSILAPRVLRTLWIEEK